MSGLGRTQTTYLTEMVSIGALRPSEENPRNHSHK